MSDPVLCTLARQHSGDCAHTETPARHACRKVIRYKDAPLDVAAKAMDAVDRDLAHHVGDGEPFDPVAHAEAMAEAEEAGKVGPGPCPQCGEPLLSEPNGVHCDQCGWEPASPPTPPEHSGPTCAYRGGIVTAWLGDPPPGWKPGMRPPCIACGAESGEECRPAATPEPSTADLLAAATAADVAHEQQAVDVEAARVALTREERFLGGTQHDVERARSALAKHVGNGRFVQVGGTTFKAIAPRKPRGGELASDALWRLEQVEVAK